MERSFALSGSLRTPPFKPPPHFWVGDVDVLTQLLLWDITSFLRHLDVSELPFFSTVSQHPCVKLIFNHRNMYKPSQLPSIFHCIIFLFRSLIADKNQLCEQRWCILYTSEISQSQSCSFVQVQCMDGTAHHQATDDSRGSVFWTALSSVQVVTLCQTKWSLSLHFDINWWLTG